MVDFNCGRGGGGPALGNMFVRVLCYHSKLMLKKIILVGYCRKFNSTLHYQITLCRVNFYIYCIYIYISRVFINLIK